MAYKKLNNLKSNKTFNIAFGIQVVSLAKIPLQINL